MKKLDKLTLLELQELGEFQDHIGFVIEDLSNYEEFIPKNKKRKYQKCYDILLDIWQSIEQNIEELCDGDKRYLKIKKK